MIKEFIKKIKKFIENRRQEKAVNEIIKCFTDEDWNRITSGVILSLYANGEKQYSTLNGFIDTHGIPEEFSKVFNQEGTLSYYETIMLQRRLTDAQEKLLRMCKSRKINSKLVAILETIDEYERTNNFADYSDSIVFDDLDK